MVATAAFRTRQHPEPPLTGMMRTRVTPGVSSFFMMIPAFCVTNTLGMWGSGCSRGLDMMMRAS